MFEDRWIAAIAAVGCGLIVGAMLGAWVRHWLSRESRRVALREIANPSSIFVFWLSTAAGGTVAMAALSPETLRPIPSDILAWLPNVLAAGLVMICGYAIAVAASGSLGRGFAQATGSRSRVAERTLRTSIIAGSIILALGQLGVETTILIVLTAGAVFGTALAAALLAGLGGKDVAASIAAGRVLTPDLKVGDTISFGPETGTVVELRPAAVVLRISETERRLISYSALLTSGFVYSTPKK